MPIISDRFATNCSTVFSNNYDTCGTVTRSTIAHLTPAQLEAMFITGGLFADLDAWFKTSIEMKACGTRTYGLYDWIMSSADRTKGKAALNVQKAMGNPSLMFPFILGKQESVINTDYWAILNGIAKSGYTGDLPATGSGTMTAGPLTAAELALAAGSDRIIRVVSNYGVDLDDKWFVPGAVMHIFTRASDGSAENGNWKVLAATTATDLSYTDVLVTTQNAGSTAAYETAPVDGVLVPGVNNVSDFESWCYNRPNWDGKKMVPFWIQTMRRTRCVDSEYQKFFARLMESGVNNAFKEFGDIPMARRNAQDELNYKKEFVNAFIYNKAISTNQTLALWGSLEAINTTSSSALTIPTEGKIMGRRANFIGVREQLRLCGRVKDLANQPLNLYELLDEIYRIMRARETNGRPTTDIDLFTDNVTKANLMTAFMQYYKQEYLEQIRFVAEIGGANELGMIWDSFRVKYPSGVRINVISHPYFDDFRDANKTASQESMGSRIWILDIGTGGTIYWSQIASNRVVHTIGELEALAKVDSTFACTMSNITQTQTLISETGTAVVECPANSLMIENFSTAVPITTGSAGSPTDLV